MNKVRSLGFPASVAGLVVVVLSVIQLVPERPMLAVERFVKGGGWVEIVILGAYAFIVSRAIRNEKVRWFTA